MPLDVTYERANIELVAKGVFGGGMPAETIRLQLDNYVPAMIMVSSGVLYWFFLVPIFFPATKPSDEAAVKSRSSLRSIHNVILFLYSAFCCISTAIYLHMEGQLFSNGQFWDWHALLCTPVEGTWLRGLSITFVVSKLYEWGDTAFLIWCGKRPPQFLHLYHHATTFWLFCLVINMPGPEKFGLLMNGGVHMLMYSHYWKSWPKALVPLITILQIMQLATVTYAWSVNPAECPEATYSDASSYPFEFFTPYLMVPVYLWFFIVFFVKRFICGKSGKKKAN